MVSHLAIATDGWWSEDAGPSNIYVCPIAGKIESTSLTGLIVSTDIKGKIETTNIIGRIEE
jgi:hypothetical protein